MSLRFHSGFSSRRFHVGVISSSVRTHSDFDSANFGFASMLFRCQFDVASIPRRFGVGFAPASLRINTSMSFRSHCGFASASFRVPPRVTSMLIRVHFGSTSIALGFLIHAIPAPLRSRFNFMSIWLRFRFELSSNALRAY